MQLATATSECLICSRDMVVMLVKFSDTIARSTNDSPGEFEG
jgi:hypothetical protein